jgi:Mg-chelatase subunit ChlD
MFSRISAAMWLALCVLSARCASPSDNPAARRGSSTSSTTSSSSPSAGSGPGSGLIVPATTRTLGTGPTGSDVCASAVVTSMRNMPNIVFVVDGSGSMCAPFGEGTRWQALRSALLDPASGFIYRLQKSVRFGATLYDGTIDMNLAGGGVNAIASLIQNPPCALLASALLPGAGMCPQLLEVMPAKLDNAQAIDMAFPEVELGGSTPTDKALGHVMDVLIPTLQQQAPDGMPMGKVYVILATDGAPNDICVGGVGGDGIAQQQGVIAAADRGAAAGITTWVISLADGDPALQMHLDEVAKHGDPTNPQAKTFTPTNPDELLMTLARLLGGAVGCHVELNGTVTVGQECLGTVEQNGVRLPCCQQDRCDDMPTSSPNGWRLNDDHSVELLGDACASFLLGSGAVLNATFPCEIFTPS